MIAAWPRFTTLRSLTSFVLDDTNRAAFGDVTVIYAARNPGQLFYRDDLERWDKRNDLNLYLTVDAGDDTWHGRVGFVPQVTGEIAPRAENAYALVCRPPIMMKFTPPVMHELGFPRENTLLSLEMKMKCGMGMCGRCNIGSKYVSTDGPVFSCAQLERSVFV
jgi:sulfhydrogenase subunit gamma (sulfur reductase)